MLSFVFVDKHQDFPSLYSLSPAVHFIESGPLFSRTSLSHGRCKYSRRGRKVPYNSFRPFQVLDPHLITL
jgi:hypothetical protein